MRRLDEIEDQFRREHPVLMFVAEAVGFSLMCAMFLLLIVLAADLP